MAYTAAGPMIGEPYGLIEMIRWYVWHRATRDLWDEALAAENWEEL